MGKLSLVEQALLLHKEYYGEGDFGTVVKDYDYYPKVAEIFINRKNRKIYSNLDIEPVASTVVHTGSSPVMAKAGRIKNLCLKMVLVHTGFILVKMKWFILFALFLTLKSGWSTPLVLLKVCQCSIIFARQDGLN